MDAKFHLCLLLIMLGTMTVQGVHPGNPMHVAAKRQRECSCTLKWMLKKTKKTKKTNAEYPITCWRLAIHAWLLDRRIDKVWFAESLWNPSIQIIQLYFYCHLLVGRQIYCRTGRRGFESWQGHQPGWGAGYSRNPT